jgi:hypothetical protein
LEKNAFQFFGAEYGLSYSDGHLPCKVQWLIGVFSQRCKFLAPKHRLKRFIFWFVCITAKVKRTGRRQVVKLFTRHALQIARANSS